MQNSVSCQLARVYIDEYSISFFYSSISMPSSCEMFFIWINQVCPYKTKIPLPNTFSTPMCKVMPLGQLSNAEQFCVDPAHQGTGYVPTYPKPFPRFQTNKRRSMTSTTVTIFLVSGSPSSSELRNSDKKKRWLNLLSSLKPLFNETLTKHIRHVRQHQSVSRQDSHHQRRCSWHWPMHRAQIPRARVQSLYL